VPVPDVDGTAPDRLRPLVLRLGLAAAGVVAVTTFAFSGVGGILLLLTAATVVAVVAAAAVVPGAPKVPPRSRPRPSSPNTPFRTYRQVAEQLSWAAVSPRHYDVVTRPLLQRLMASRLLDRHGVDVRTSPEAARALVGDDVWPDLDPTRPPASDSQPPGMDARRLELLVQRLEAL
jgi:hypothetical protein